MSTMLSTSSPEAFEEITMGSHDRRKPYVGQMVLFHLRPGGRGSIVNNQNRTTRPAMVMGVGEGGYVDLVVFYGTAQHPNLGKVLDCDDRENVPRRSEQNPVESWSFNDHDEQHHQAERARF
jgi:hypothetical protein